MQVIADKAPVKELKPLLFVIPYQLVKNSLKEADIDAAARASSLGYIVESLPRDHFDVFDLSEGSL